MIANEDIDIQTQVFQRWTRQRAVSRRGVNRAELAACESRLRVKLPEEFAKLFLLIDGMDAEDYDSNYIRFLPLSEIAPLAAFIAGCSVANKDYLVFAEWSLWAHGYGINVGHGPHRGKVAILSGRDPIEIANSFGEFLDLYLNAPKRIF